jgi:phospholipid/cholesterol/gamma-HCH transport system ATP-binding protein
MSRLAQALADAGAHGLIAGCTEVPLLLGAEDAAIPLTDSAEVLAQVGLAASVGDLSPAELSGGMQKRVALARAVAAAPDLLFFDEPTTGLDPIMGAVIDGLIVDCVQRLGATAISITHDMASARRIGQRAAMIYKGRIVWDGPAASLGQTGNAMVDQFARGEREGPISMELRR